MKIPTANRRIGDPKGQTIAKRTVFLYFVQTLGLLPATRHTGRAACS
jgi:hypothetical protein